MISLTNLLYLAIITSRIPVLPGFAPSHIPESAGMMPFRRVFDIDRLSDAIRLPIVEWDRLKDPESDVVDTMGCWSLVADMFSPDRVLGWTSMPWRYKLGV